jgi:hypothetical protein
MRSAALLFCLCTVGFANTWSGYLVDSKCWTSRQENVTWETSVVGRDMRMDLYYCLPTAKTRVFAVVLYDWSAVKLGSAGNELAADLVRRAGKKPLIDVTVTGVLDRKTIQSAAIPAATVRKR